MLGDYIVTILFFLCIIGMVCIFFRNAVPGILQAFIIVLKLLAYVIILPFVALLGIFKFLFRRRTKIVGFITKTETFSRDIIHRNGSRSRYTESYETKIPVKSKNVFNKSGRF